MWWLSKNKRLLRAAEAGDAGSVSALLGKGANPEIRNDNNDTPLAIAAEKGHYEVVAALLAVGADVNAQNKNCSTALHSAAANEHSQVVRVLLEHGPDLNICSHDGFTALHLAVAEPEIIKRLLEAGADPNIPNMYGMTPLMLAKHRAAELTALGRAKSIDLLERAAALAAGRSKAESSAAENVVANYLETYRLVTGGPMTTLRATMAKVLLAKRSPDEVMAFCRKTREALEEGGDASALAKTFLKFENPSDPRAR